MSPITTINENLRLELRPGADGFGVDAIYPNDGVVAPMQVFWSKSEEAARAYIAGVAFMAAQ